MTVSNESIKTSVMIGNGSNKSWPFTIRCTSADDLRIVYVDANGVETDVTADFSVALNGDQKTSPGGTVTYPVAASALTASESLVIVLDKAYLQDLDLTLGGNFNPESIEDALDDNTQLIQQVHEKAERAMALPISVTGYSSELPTPVPGKPLVWGTSGLVNSDSTVSTTDADSVTFTPEGTGAVATTVKNYLWYGRYVDNHIPSGATDHTAGIQSALDAYAGKEVRFRERNYTITGQLDVYPGTGLIGQGGLDFYKPNTQGTWANVEHTSAPGFLLGRGARMEKMGFYYPDQVTSGTPTVYDYAIASDVSDAEFNGNNPGIVLRDLILVNPYRGINLDGDTSDLTPNTGAVEISGVRMYPLDIGIRVGATASEMNFTDIVFSPLFWQASTGQAIRSWVPNNGTSCILIQSGQGVQMVNTTMFGHKRGIYLYNPAITSVVPEGSINFLMASNCLFDGLVHGIEVTGYFGIGDGQFTGCHFESRNFGDDTAVDCHAVYFNETYHNNFVDFAGCKFMGTAGDHIHVESADTSSYSKINVTGGGFYTVNPYSRTTGEFNNLYMDQLQGQLKVIGAEFINLVHTSSSPVNYFNVQNARRLTTIGNTSQDTTSRRYKIGTVTWKQHHDDDFLPSTNADIWGATPAVYHQIASAATITIPTHGNTFLVTGTTNITDIADTWNGRPPVTLIFSGALTLTDSANLVLSSNFTTTNGDTLQLGYYNGNWYEISRSVN